MAPIGTLRRPALDLSAISPSRGYHSGAVLGKREVIGPVDRLRVRRQKQRAGVKRSVPDGVVLGRRDAEVAPQSVSQRVHRGGGDVAQEDLASALEVELVIELGDRLGGGYSFSVRISPMKSEWRMAGGEGGAVTRLTSASIGPQGRSYMLLL